MTTTTTTATQTKTVSVSAAMGRMKKAALYTTAFTALAVAGFYGYQLYKKGKVVVDVVAEPVAEDATETTTETTTTTEAA